MQPLSGNQNPDCPNISDEHVSCTAHATRTACFQIPLKCPMPAIVFETATKPSRFARLARCTIPCPCHAKPHLNARSGPKPSAFNTFDVEMCFTPQRRALFQHLNFQKCSEAEVFCAFGLRMCFAPQRRALFRHLSFQKWSEPGVFCTF